MYETGSAITSTGALSAYSGAKTGRSPSDKRIVEEDGSTKEVWWGPVNKPMSQDVRHFDSFRLHFLQSSEPTFAHPSNTSPCLSSLSYLVPPSCHSDLSEIEHI